MIDGIDSVKGLTAALLDARSRTLALVEGLDEGQLMGPILPTVNPLRWEIAHVAYFHELWVLRHLGGREPIRKDADALFDSISIPHEQRWQLPLPCFGDTFAYMHDVLQAELEQLSWLELDDWTRYFYLLALFHEDMHGEAFTYVRQTLGYPRPGFMRENEREASSVAPGRADVEIEGGTFLLGAERDDAFRLDNEKWAHEVTVAPFRIARYAVSNEDYLEFVEADGYRQERYWSVAGWQWRHERRLEHPIYWKKDSGQWYVRQFDQWNPLVPAHAVIHVSWYEAEAFCNWAERRLPTEAEWEFTAACGPNGKAKKKFPWGDDWREGHANLDGSNSGPLEVNAFSQGDSAFACRQMIGNVWEWTASVFSPYPGFSPDCYTEYSRPSFGQTRVLRGGAWTTRGRMLRNTWRNYYGADRNDVFAGFRTCTR